MFDKYVDYVDIEISKMMRQLGWNLYTPTQFYCDKITQMSIGDCALIDLLGKEIYYRPTVEQTLNWILDYFNIIICVDVNHDGGAYMYNVYDTTDVDYTKLSTAMFPFSTPIEAKLYAIRSVLTELIEDSVN